MVATFRSALTRSSLNSYHRRHSQEARAALQGIEHDRGPTPPALLRRCNEYAADALGWSGYARWLHVYCAVAGEFREGWIPDDYYGEVVVPKVKRAYAKLSHLKALSGPLFRSEVFPDLAYRTHGALISRSYHPIRWQDLEELLFRTGERAVFKPDFSRQGRQIVFLTRASFDPAAAMRLGNGVFQRHIEQHPFFSALMPSSVATLRITTTIEDGTPTARTSFLRLGRTADTHVRSQTHVRIPVDVRNGRLATQGYLPTWHTIDRHPDTSVAFHDLKIPAYSECVSTALALHRQVPFVQCVGWDLVVDRHGEVKVIEWNSDHNDIKFSEATQGPCFRDLHWDTLWRAET